MPYRRRAPVTSQGTPAPYQPADCMQQAPRSDTRRLWIVLAMTAVFMVVEAVGGWVSGSLALVADAGHMLTDVGALGLTLLTAWIGQRPADDRKTYGYMRWEILAALINGAALIGVAAWVVIEAVHRMETAHPIRADLLMVVAAAGLMVNAIALRLLHAGHRHSLNTRGAYLHVMSDLLGSAGALAAGVVIALTGWTPIDPILSVALAVLILAGAWRLVRESTDILLEAVPRGISMRDVHRRMLRVDGVTAVHDVHVWTVTSGVIAMSGHAIVPELDLHPEVLDGIRAGVAELGIGHVTIQLEVEDAGCEPADTVACARKHAHPH